jgi:hypothetical protein
MPVLFQEGPQQLRTADALLHAEEKNQPIYLDLAFSNLLGLHAALLNGRQRYCLIELSLRQNFANWFSVGVVLRGLGAQRFP